MINIYLVLVSLFNIVILIILLLVGSKLPNQVINEDGDLTRVFSNTISSYEEEMSNSQLHTFDSSPDDVMFPPCCCIPLEYIIEDEPESDKNRVGDEFVYTLSISLTDDKHLPSFGKSI